MSEKTHLMYCLRNTMRQALQCEDVRQVKELLGASELLINELLLRQDAHHESDYLAQGKQLLVRGIACLERHSADFSDIQAEFTRLSTQVSLAFSKDAVEMQLAQTSALLRQVVARLPSVGDSLHAEYLNAVCAWEVAAYARRLEVAPEPDQDLIENPVITAEKFAHYLTNKFPEWGDIEVVQFRQIPGGFSNSTFLLEVKDHTHGTRELVVRAQQVTDVIPLYINRVEDEFPIVKLAYEQGLTVAKPLWAEKDASLLGTTFLVSMKASGKNLGTATGATEEITAPMLRGLVNELYKIHCFDLSANRANLIGTELESWDVDTIEESIRKDIQFWRYICDETGVTQSPLIERAFRWLEENIPASNEAPVLLHADSGLHNILIDGETVTAVLDWEACHIGDPANDLSLLLSCTSQYASEEQLLQYYQEAGGVIPSDFRMAYQDVFNCIRVPIASLAALRLLERRQDNIQYAVLGLRFTHHQSSRLIECIERAELAKAAQ